MAGNMNNMKEQRGATEARYKRPLGDRISRLERRLRSNRVGSSPTAIDTCDSRSAAVELPRLPETRGDVCNDKKARCPRRVAEQRPPTADPLSLPPVDVYGADADDAVQQSIYNGLELADRSNRRMLAA